MLRVAYAIGVAPITHLHVFSCVMKSISIQGKLLNDEKTRQVTITLARQLSIEIVLNERPIQKKEKYLHLDVFLENFIYLFVCLLIVMFTMMIFFLILNFTRSITGQVSFYAPKGTLEGI